MFNYFVAGLPRSRTAWLSVFLSQSGIYCFHDGMNGCGSIDEYKQKIKGCGDSSTGLHLFDINGLFPESKILVIEKSREELIHCVNWCMAAYPDVTEKSIFEQYDKLSSVTGLKVMQSDIDNRLEEIFEYLTGKEWNTRYSSIKNLNIQADFANVDIESAKRLMNE